MTTDDTMGTILAIVNPKAGGGRAAERWRAMKPLVERHLSFTEEWTTAPGHATEIARQAAERGVDRVLAIGGDGTVHEVVNGLAGTHVALGLLPMGTGNDFARSAGVSGQTEDIAARLAKGSTRAVDLGFVNGRYYINVAGVGFDAQVARIVSEMPRKGQGTVPYLATAVRLAFHYENPALTITLDGTEQAPQKRLLIAVGNGAAYGGGMKICPGARIDDGLLNVLLVDALHGFPLLGLLAMVFRGGHLRDRRVSMVQAREIHVDGPSSVPVHADGEVIGGLPATFSVKPGALQLWTPGPS